MLIMINVVVVVVTTIKVVATKAAGYLSYYACLLSLGQEREEESEHPQSP